MEIPSENIIVIGGSAGAYELIVEILDSLPTAFSDAIVIVLHRNSKYETKIESSLSKRLNRNVISVRDKLPILGNHIYFAPPGYHTLVEPDHIFSLDISDPVQFSRPSIDVFFESVAAVYGNHATAFILSGANNDGSEGIKTLINYGAVCYAQNPQEAVIETMPQAGMQSSKKVKVLSNQQIIDYFSQLT
ncbi:chemotaxis protein CheB [Sphingobacterium daejeonense]|uniref:chemotaxis protein CheB n=1 Tax=Sphingobacterium daejeonense TaxID=371142 RepID=UPI0010C24B52|nr:chemotaxis protein CheB [Sphingobacterium daejeonense]MCT1529539.1 chemotaxis protein CheB [Sphingobacterium daejeonense]VTP89973.1 Chemotaxis response regulator protein-glutamate methylesterase [Sphingobacterium daejeonense]